MICSVYATKKLVGVRCCSCSCLTEVVGFVSSGRLGKPTSRLPQQQDTDGVVGDVS